VLAAICNPMNFNEERNTVERFRKLYFHFPDGEISQPNQPDFIVSGKTVVGIEVTQIFMDQNNPGGSLIKAKDSFRRNLLENIVEALKQTNFPKCTIAVHLNDEFYSKTLNPGEISKVCLADITSQQNTILEDGYYEFENEGTLPDIIEGYSIGAYKSLNDISYVETTGAVGKALTNDFIQFVLDKKERAKRKFIKCDTFWLLIKEGDFEGDYFGVLTVDKSQLKSSFDKVFLLRRRNEELVELK
jgi:hypothetical protein